MFPLRELFRFHLCLISISRKQTMESRLKLQKTAFNRMKLKALIICFKRLSKLYQTQECNIFGINQILLINLPADDKLLLEAEAMKLIVYSHIKPAVLPSLAKELSEVDIHTAYFMDLCRTYTAE